MNKNNIKDFFVDIEFLYQAIEESTDNYIYIGNMKTNMFLVSQNMVEDFGFSGEMVEDLINLWGNRIEERDYDRYRQSIQDILEGKTDEHNLEYQICTKYGKYIWVHCKGKVKRDIETGEIITFAGIVQNMESNGKVDSITGLYSHEKCKEQLEQVLENQSYNTGGMLLLGIDEFTQINTLNNHSFGDRVLRNTIQDIQKMIPTSAYIYRFDGDQFIITYYNASTNDVQELYEMIQAYTLSTYNIEDINYQFTISAGVVMFPEDANNWYDLIKYASIALKYAKESGKNRCTFFSTQMLQHEMREQRISQMLGESIRSGFQGFYLVYQPFNDSNTLNIVGAEALLRFKSKEYGVISPVEFIPILESNYLIIPVGKWILEEAVKTCKEWIRKNPKFVININVSYLQLAEPDFCSNVAGILEKHDLDPKHITLEITESYFIQNLDTIKRTFKYLRSMGIKIAMDDFGTGYSSLGRLSQFDINTIKIDRLFVESLSEKGYNYDFIKAVIGLCHNIGMKVCVEGIETEEQQYSISSLKADYIQGYYVSKPISEKEFYNLFIKTVI